jgi:hypothetical protein
VLGGGRQGRPLIIYGAIAFGIGLAFVLLMIASDVKFLMREALVLLIGGTIAMIRGVTHVTAERRAAAPLGTPPGGGLGAAPGYGQGGFAGAPGPGFTPAPGFTAPQQGYGAPGYPGTPGPGSPASPGFAPAPGFTPQAVGGPPMPGWFADPQNPTMLRWWDGQAWTARTQPTSASFPVGPVS